MASSVIPRPFLKWAGGKTQLVDELTNRMPGYFIDYHEPFVGGGALFLELSRRKSVRKAYISDINAELVDAYRAIRDCVDQVIAQLSQFPYSREFFYRLRSQDPWRLDLPTRAARMIYLNKTCYNGLYRVNSKGQFNVPFGRYESPNYRDEDNLRAVSRALQDVDIGCASFDRVLAQARAGDLVYFDPPYAPLSQTAKFTAYSSTGFSSEQQKQLRDVCLELTSRNVNLMLSNSDTELTRSLYASESFVISRVMANRFINCNGNRRGKLTELIVTNYPFDAAAQLRLLESRAQFRTVRS